MLPVPIPPPDVVHKYEFPSETMTAPFGAGWTLSGSHTRSTYFPVGSTLDDIISMYNGLQDVGSRYVMEKTVVLCEVTYTRNKSTDTIMLRYSAINPGIPTVTVTGNVTSTEQQAAQELSAGTGMTGWTITNTVNHPVVTLTTPGGKGGATVNPRFLSMFEAIGYKRSLIGVNTHANPSFTANVGLPTAQPSFASIVRFTNTTPQTIAWLWSFGDGQTSTQQHPIRTYTAAGEYVVSLRVIYADGIQSALISETITIPIIQQEQYMIHDTFDGPVSLIGTHIANTGQAWIGGDYGEPDNNIGGELTGTGSVVAGIDYDAAYNTIMSGVVNFPIPVDNYYVQVTVNVPVNAESNTFIGLIGRIQDPTWYRYMVDVNWWPCSTFADSNGAELKSGLNISTWGNGATNAGGPENVVMDLPKAIGQHVFRVEYTPTQYRAYIDGVLRLTQPLDSSVQNPGYCGYMICQRLDATPGVGIEILEFKTDAL